MKTEWWAMGFTLCATIVGSFGSLFLKIGADRSSRRLRDIVRNLWILAGIVFFLLSTPFFLIGLRGGELSVLYPMLSLSYVWVVLLSRCVLREDLGRGKAASILLIVIGVVLVGLGGR